MNERFSLCLFIVPGQIRDMLQKKEYSLFTFITIRLKALKKISSLEKISCNCNEIKGYSVPKLPIGKDWNIGYNAYDSLTHKIKRKKIKINHIDKVTQCWKFADQLVKPIKINIENK